MKKILLIILISISIIYLNTSFTLAQDWGSGKIIDPLKPDTSEDFVSITQRVVVYLVGFIYLIAIILGLYGGFMILTSGGEEEKVKKGKNILVFVIIGIVVIFFSSVLITWVVDSINSNDILGT